MPPQQTNITSGTERDAAGLGLDLPIAFPAATSPRSVLGLLKRYWRAFQERRQRQGLRAGLDCLSDRQLMDIGLTRGDVDCITPQHAIDRIRDSAMYLLSRGG
ncbi:DUF1127 domain-containing protein [Bradyrhizobium sp. JYMT SZCCT0180]|uniref:DUF1127 domain-containing protein n=1 Tax=Bradyrhizobium sp. JYMT SZCCT0180 TaxID=2807666 RepID=UPI001BAB4132|nr:DUF1127 domain-containing protein [Bradyrhizobium sp. JYMT SZCCT0180]MBR1213471.1 DUF1127 domain-containing protein [Bradyrhizobium sp. JYMT SZCCT0180]